MQIRHIRRDRWCRCKVDIPALSFFFFFNDTATTEIYTLSLHDALPISSFATPPPSPTMAAHSTSKPTLTMPSTRSRPRPGQITIYSILSIPTTTVGAPRSLDRKSTRLNSSHTVISYAVFCLKKKKNNHPQPSRQTDRSNSDNDIYQQRQSRTSNMTNAQCLNYDSTATTTLSDAQNCHEHSQT